MEPTYGPAISPTDGATDVDSQLSTVDGGPSTSGQQPAAAVSSGENTNADDQKSSADDRPTCVIVLGMAGSGKSTVVKRLMAHLVQAKSVPYTVNLDPAIHDCAFPAHIDIRDTVNYKELMKQHNLGPNGAIVTALNLFVTRLDQLLTLIKARETEHKHILIDTPGQIEVFTWSASGTVLTEALAAQYPTVILYVMDVARSVRPVTFMSNMLYACSILCRLRLPFVLLMNKTDIVGPKFAMEWMRDFEAFLAAVEDEKGYVANFTRSQALVLDEFYADLKAVGFSAVTGEGTEKVLQAISDARKEYFDVYLPEYERLKEKKNKAAVERQRQEMEQMRVDHRGSADDKRRDKKVSIGGFEDDDECPEDEDDERQDVQSFNRWLRENK